MKKKLLAILCLTISITVTGCGQSSSSSASEKEIAELKAEIEELKEENNDLKAKLYDYEKSQLEQPAEASGLAGFVAETSGVCGADLMWEYGDGILRISGTGAMSDFKRDNVPWADIREKIGHVYVDDGVTSIGKEALNSLGEMSKLVIASTVTSINIGDIESCEQLKELNLPDDLSNIHGISPSAAPASWNEQTEEEKERAKKEEKRNNLTRTFEKFDTVSWKGKQYSAIEELIRDLEDAGVIFDY